VTTVRERPEVSESLCKSGEVNVKTVEKVKILAGREKELLR
jgi:hypothetical protein